MKYVVLILIIISAIIAALFYFRPASNEEGAPRLKISDALRAESPELYRKADSIIDFKFPRDFLMHEGFKTEWIYFTGNLKTANGRRFGFQFTIFRNALSPHETKSQSKWAAEALYMAHVAISDFDGEEFFYEEKFSRGDGRLAGCDTSQFKIWLENFKIDIIHNSNRPKMPGFKLKAETKEISLDINLQSAKPLILQGDRGLSQKGPEKGNASYYFSITRMLASGQINVKGEKFEVSGYSWMDKEWGTSALGENLAGWDWFSIQLDDTTEIMYYQLRNKNGVAGKYSSGSLIGKKGEKHSIAAGEAILEPKRFWDSPHGSRYPVSWALKIPGHKISLQIDAVLENQELNTTIKYWEGAVSVKGFKGGKEITGRGYLEMTGYGEDVKILR